ncbi:MAG TPA: GGDEF domain-containing protein, partial [Duganella sp.]|nr:GGDEF domain-containing protein [Duganella sp.]
MGMYSRLFVPIFIIIAMVVGVRYTLLFQGETATANARYQQDASDIGIHLHKALLPALTTPDRAALDDTLSDALLLSPD